MSAQLPLPLPVETLDQARRGLEAGLNKGVKCPCCGQYAKQYRRKMTSSMAVALILMYGEHRRTKSINWIHFQSFIATKGLRPMLASALHGGMHAKLRFWGLLEEPPEVVFRPKDSPKRGLFRLTQAGIDFVEGKSAVLKFAVIYNNVCHGLAGPPIDVRVALTEKFAYDELMRGI